MLANKDLFFESTKDLFIQVEKFEKDKRINLPKDFKNYILKNNKLPSKDISFVHFKKYNWGKTTNYDCLEWEGLPKGAIIFAQDLGGNVYCFYKNQIYFITHDPLKIIKFANTFNDFLKKIK
jgi:hypothetical protein